MKARYIRGDIETGGVEANPDSVHLVEKVKNHSAVQVLCWKIGAILDIPNAFRYVQMGVCEAADDECAKRANMTPQKMADRKKDQAAQPPTSDSSPWTGSL